MRRQLFVVLTLFYWLSTGLAQQTSPNPQTSASPNNLVSDFGTSFTFSVPPVCPGCVEVETGIARTSELFSVPAVLTIAPLNSHTDFTVLFNSFQNSSVSGRRVNQTGSELDLVIRQQVFASEHLTVAIAPRAAIFTRGGLSPRFGAALGVQYGRGPNTLVVNSTLTGTASPVIGNPSLDYLTSGDYYRALGSKGYSIFAGLQHEIFSQTQIASFEQGLVVPVKHGQIEFNLQELGINGRTVLQQQVKLILNTGKIIGKK